MISSPPQEAEHIRGKTLTPESPKPVHYPSPANIPILEKQMDPMFNEPPLSIGTPASFHSYPQQTQTPSAQSSASYYAEQQPAANYQNIASHGSVDATPVGYPPSMGYNGGGLGAQQQSQDTSAAIQSLQNALHNPPAASPYSETKYAPQQDTRSTYAPNYDPNAYAAHQTQAQPSQGHQQFQNPVSAGAGVNYQSLLNSLSPTAYNGASDRYGAPAMSVQPAQSHGQTPISALPAGANLPPRPPAQDRNATHPSDDIRSYHPHSQKPSNNQFRAPGQLQPLNIRSGGSNSMEPYSATRSNHSPSTSNYGQRHSVDRRSETPGDDEDSRWPPEVNRLYEEFLDDERRYVTDGQWDQFPFGSRLFIGNLPTEKVTKRDIFHRFYRHGRLGQISIKQAYGFVQFMDTASCSKALEAEQGQAVRGRKMHLEVSKPQRNTKKADAHANDRNAPRRRSRSPDYTRGGTGNQSRNADRYSGSSSNVMSPRDRDNRRIRDDYRPPRSPSPQRGGRGMRGSGQGRDRYEPRRRSRSRSPRRYRSPSPRRDSNDDLPLPYRAPHQIPDIQVLVINEGLPRDYIRWVEDSFRQQGLKADVLILSPRLSEGAVIRRQIVEGVLAIVKLNTATLSKSKVNLQVFDRRGGAGNVQFNEYADLEPATAAALVLNAKQNAVQPVQAPPAPAYGHQYSTPSAPPSYGNPGPPPAQYPPAAASNPPNFSNLISGLDSNGLSQLLGAMSQNNASQPAPSQPAALSPDLARLLVSVSSPTQASSYAGTPQAAPQGYANMFQNASLASLLGGQTPSQQPAMVAPPVQTPTQATLTGQPDMTEIMAQLAKYQR
ncbi:hypothetical protein K491DRAFT_586856 [Lophiostoma macrostomum CBS 122681]|uniref:RRM domain-containing protein n=1 Tax=Lophiostoma macrostomum CBS 122681 TaxID=1314788 RepID=A0A6A6TP06_9PLEO|nr:hypothetical protein K491DRAFT_586856 [Lophiostoma macrostomum CBS 122681]